MQWCARVFVCGMITEEVAVRETQAPRCVYGRLASCLKIMAEFNVFPDGPIPCDDHAVAGIRQPCLRPCCVQICMMVRGIAWETRPAETARQRPGKVERAWTRTHTSTTSRRGQQYAVTQPLRRLSTPCTLHYALCTVHCAPLQQELCSRHIVSGASAGHAVTRPREVDGQLTANRLTVPGVAVAPISETRFSDFFSVSGENIGLASRDEYDID
jgi:hypothetical protein